jgi:hypothetical protein
MKAKLGALAIVASTFACVLSFSPTWTGQDGLSLTSRAEARARVYIHGGTGGYYTATGLPWYAVRAHYFGGPWSGPYYSYAGWSAYAAQNGIGCTPGTVVKGGDGVMYNCQ